MPLSNPGIRSPGSYLVLEFGGRIIGYVSLRSLRHVPITISSDESRGASIASDSLDEGTRWPVSRTPNEPNPPTWSIRSVGHASLSPEEVSRTIQRQILNIYGHYVTPASVCDVSLQILDSSPRPQPPPVCPVVHRPESCAIRPTPPLHHVSPPPPPPLAPLSWTPVPLIGGGVSPRPQCTPPIEGGGQSAPPA